MITFADAEKIVHNSVSSMASRTVLETQDTLSDLGIHSMSDFHNLIQMIVQVGVSSMWAKIEPQDLVGLTTMVTIGSLINTLQISARKLCSNPVSPHEQPCCPYPTICGECPYPVLQ